MNHEVADEWVKRLKSGQYEQGNKHLNYDNRYCCLGVLCEIYCEQVENIKEMSYELAIYGGDVYYLPNRVADWAGINFEGGLDFNIGDRKFISLAEANDEFISFNQIADVIEQNKDRLTP